MLIRLPGALEYTAQVEKEQYRLPKLAPFLPLPIPSPVAMGKPSEEYLWYWSIYEWIEGQPASKASITNLFQFVKNLANFLLTLQEIDTTGGLNSGKHNFFRGGSLKTYNAEVREAIKILSNMI